MTEDHIRSVTAITRVYTFGQKVAAVAVEYQDTVHPETLGLDTFTVTDSVYNFRFNPIEDLEKRADRTITRIYTNDRPMLSADGVARPGRYVIVELDPADPGGNTVINSKRFDFLTSEKINPDLPTRVVQNRHVHARSGDGGGPGKVLGAAGPASHPLTNAPVNILADDFRYETYDHSGTALPYAFHLPADHDPHHAYPLVIVLPGWGSGFDGDNLGVQIAVDITATAWLQPERTGGEEEPIILAPQNQRVGTEAESAAMVALFEAFSSRYRIDRDRVHVSAYSWGSTLAFDAMARHPELFAAVLINAGFRIEPDQATRIATAKTPFWITHGTNDPILSVEFGRDTVQRLRDAYLAAGASPAEVEHLVRYTEYPDDAFGLPDYHAVVGPVYEDPAMLRWLLRQSRGTGTAKSDH